MIKELNILREVELTEGSGSTKIKQNLILDNFTPEMEYMLNLALNPFIRTNINKLEEVTTKKQTDLFAVPVKMDYDFTAFQGIMTELVGAKSANNDMRKKALDFIKGFSSDPEERMMLTKIMTKSLNIGLGKRSLNKALHPKLGKKFIPNPSLMLADKEESIIKGWETNKEQMWCEMKYDGVRVAAIMAPDTNGQMDITFWTRNFNELDGSCMTNIKRALLDGVAEMAKLGSNKLFFFDGELTDINRKSVSGKVNKILKGTAPKDIDNDFLFNIFDMELATTLDNEVGTTPYTTRRRALEIFFEKGNIPKGSCLTLGERWDVNSLDDIMGIYEDIVKKGGEGVIVKNEHLYEIKRSKSWVKIKEIQECDLEITGHYPGNAQSKREEKGWIGGFNCKSACGELRVNVGSGFGDKLLEEIKGQEDSYIGKIVTLKYNVRIEDEHGNHSLFLPRLVEIRNDKTVADTEKQID